jgi:hypothetical protein
MAARHHHRISTNCRTGSQTEELNEKKKKRQLDAIILVALWRVSAGNAEVPLFSIKYAPNSFPNLAAKELFELATNRDYYLHNLTSSSSTCKSMNRNQIFASKGITLVTLVNATLQPVCDSAETCNFTWHLFCCTKSSVTVIAMNTLTEVHS